MSRLLRIVSLAVQIFLVNAYIFLTNYNCSHLNLEKNLGVTTPCLHFVRFVK